MIFPIGNKKYKKLNTLSKYILFINAHPFIVFDWLTALEYNINESIWGFFYQ